MCMNLVIISATCVVLHAGNVASEREKYEPDMIKRWWTNFISDKLQSLSLQFEFSTISSTATLRY